MVTKNMPYVKYMTKMILSNIFNYPQSSDFLRYNHFYSVLWQNKIYDIKVFSVQKWDTPKIRQNKILVCDDKILVSRNKTPQKIWASKYYAHLMFIFFFTWKSKMCTKMLCLNKKKIIKFEIENECFPILSEGKGP